MSWRLGGLTGQVIFSVVCLVRNVRSACWLLGLGTLQCHEVFKEHRLFDSPGQWRRPKVLGTCHF